MRKNKFEYKEKVIIILKDIETGEVRKVEKKKV